MRWKEYVDVGVSIQPIGSSEYDPCQTATTSRLLTHEKHAESCAESVRRRGVTVVCIGRNSVIDVRVASN